ncbi:MAG: TIGR00295 family protein [Candidatus Methanoperedens sp.]|nr:TIGR00295 family protein [Candidatus Methanoperedens sp.]MCZ7398851.1 TIGR00295 family protein [Candidatus Methanoperedens sp.]
MSDPRQNLTEKDAIALLISSGCSPDVIEHCKTVAEYARQIAINIRKSAEKKGQSIDIDMDAVYLGGLLHDIGRSKTHGIGHAVAGAAIAVENGLSDKLVNIIERHIGAGIPKEEAVGLGIPKKDYMPVTIEEKIVAHADNLVFGNKRGTADEMVRNLKKKKIDEKIIHRFIELNNEINSMMD